MEKFPMGLFGKNHTENSLQGFEVKPELEALIADITELQPMGTAISLDPDGLSSEQIAYFYDRMTDITQNHGTELLEYLQPYANLSASEKKKLDAADFDRLNVLGTLPRQIEYYKNRLQSKSESS